MISLMFTITGLIIFILAFLVLKSRAISRTMAIILVVAMVLWTIFNFMLLYDTLNKVL